MTAEEIAKALFDELYLVCQEYTEEIQCSLQAKQCALNAVDEFIDIFGKALFDSDIELLKQVKQEIEKL